MKTLLEEIRSMRIRSLKKRLKRGLKTIELDKRKGGQWRSQLLRMRVLDLKDLVRLIDSQSPIDNKLIVEAVFRLMVENQALDLVTLSEEVRKVCHHRGVKKDRLAITTHLVELFDEYGASKTY